MNMRVMQGLQRIITANLCLTRRLRSRQDFAVATSIVQAQLQSHSHGNLKPGVTIKDTKSQFCSVSTPSHGTIFALASGHGKCGVAVVRVSGPNTRLVLEKMIQSKDKVRSRHAVLSQIYDPITKELIDHGLILWFNGPNSFTGEDVCEMQVHGGPAVIAALYEALAKLDGFHLAEAGEFSKRAFYNGKLDLTEVEGLGDLIHAETEAQRRQAVRQMTGVLSQLYQGWRIKLLRTVAHVEAFIDFSEDENIEEGVLEEARLEVNKLLGEVRRHLQDNRRGERLRNGVHVTIAGQPNVGKSTLLNALCQRPAAIVSPIAGTTRDVVESSLNIGGYPVVLSDTAGIRESFDEIEMEGVRRARERTSLADLVIYMLDATTLNSQASPEDFLDHIHSEVKDAKLWNELNPEHSTCDQNTRINADLSENKAVEQRNSDETIPVDLGHSNGRDVVVLVNKIDLLNEETKKRLPSLVPDVSIRHREGRLGIIPMSCKTDEGMDAFLGVLGETLKEMCTNPSSSDPFLTQERHRNHLTKCALALESFESRDDLVMAAEELRIALRQLGKITGHVTTEEVLDVIFKDFCIGK